MLLEGKVAIVTGAGAGIGRGIALRLAAEGADVVVSDIVRDEAGAVRKGQVAEEVKAMGRRSAFIPCDVADMAGAKAMVDQAIQAMGRVDILVNNAGTTRDGLLVRMSEADWDTVLDVNLKGPFNCTKAVAMPMIRQKSGCIVNIASVVGFMGNAGQANYTAAKGGLIALTRTTARELASRNIRVNAVAPGFVRTKMTDILNDKLKESLFGQIPMGKFGEPEDIGNAVVFLVSNLASYITGQVLNVDGGMLMG